MTCEGLLICITKRYMYTQKGEMFVLQDSRKTLYFNDGKRRIDYVLAYVADGNADKARKRDFFQESLKGQGLELETADRSVSACIFCAFLKMLSPTCVYILNSCPVKFL